MNVKDQLKKLLGQKPVTRERCRREKIINAFMVGIMMIVSFLGLIGLLFIASKVPVFVVVIIGLFILFNMLLMLSFAVDYAMWEIIYQTRYASTEPAAIPAVLEGARL